MRLDKRSGTILLIGCILSGCATFSKKDFKKVYARPEHPDLKSFEGTYSYFPTKEFFRGSVRSHPDCLTKSVNVYSQITHEENEQTTSDSIEKLSCKARLLVKDKNTLILNVLMDDEVCRSAVLKGKLKKNGMFYLSDKELEIRGVPYIFGGWYHSKGRMVISKENNLIVNTAISFAGTLLIFVEGGSYNEAYEFQRLE